MSIESDLAEVFASARCGGWLHAVDVDGGAEIGLGEDQLVVTASTFKVPVLVELARQWASREQDPTERMRVPADRRTLGPTGISVMRDDVELSQRDLAFWMMCVSDNTATDVLMERVGSARIAALLRALGLEDTVVPDDCEAILSGMVADLGMEGQPLAAWLDVDQARLAAVRALDPAQTNRTTPRDMTRLLSMVWRDEAGPSEACAEVRRIMALQVWPHRLRAGFPDGVAVAGKTGSLLSVRNEVGVVTYGDGGRYAVAVFTRADSFANQRPEVDAAIGRAARLAVDHLRA